MDDPARRYADRAYEHISHLAGRIGARPSARAGEQDAARYAARVLLHAGLRQVRLESFEAPFSTYAPYRRVYAFALFGSLVFARLRSRLGALVAAVLSGLAAYGFYAEADLADNWTRRLLRRGLAHNVVAIVPAAQQRRQRVVVYGHLDSHRTPVFYSNPPWLRVFSLLVGAGFISLCANAALYAARAAGLLGERKTVPGAIDALVRRTGTGLQLFGLALTAQADLSPFTAGANDNASGAATALALGERLASEPLAHSEVWVINTSCEEVGAYGIAALLDRHGDVLRDALFVDVDMVGMGDPAFIPRQGLLRRRAADAWLVEAARAVAAAQPELHAWEHSTDAFDDSYMVARRGFRGMTIDAEGRPGTRASANHKHWHRPSDTIDKIDPETLRAVHAFAWALLQHLDEHAAT